MFGKGWKFTHRPPFEHDNIVIHNIFHQYITGGVQMMFNESHIQVIDNVENYQRKGKK